MKRFGEVSLGGEQSAPDYIRSRGKGLPPEPPAALAHQLAIPPWDVHKIPTATDFNTFTADLLTLPAAVNATVRTTLATGGFFVVPANNVAKLETVVFSINGPAITDIFRLTIFENGSPIPGLANIGFPPVNASYFALPIKSSWQISEGATLFGQFTNIAGTGPLRVGLVLSGYFASTSDIFRYTGQRKGQINTTGDPASRLRYLAR